MAGVALRSLCSQMRRKRSKLWCRQRRSTGSAKRISHTGHRDTKKFICPRDCCGKDQAMINRKPLILKCTITALAAVALAGCGKVDPPPFRLNMTNVVAKQIAPENQQAIANIMDAMFGT